MTRRCSVLLGVAVVLVLASGMETQARPPRRGAVWSPFGELYNTNSAEWRASGGNPLVYQQLMEQRLIRQQEQQVLRQQQQMLKAQQQTQTKGKVKAKARTKTDDTDNGLTTQPIAPSRAPKKKQRSSGRAGTEARKSTTAPTTSADAVKP